jgi:hypothetical protein
MDIQFVTSDKLKAYIDVFDGQLRRNIWEGLIVCGIIDRTLPEQTRNDIDTIINGCRVYVRYLQGVDASLQSSIEFVAQGETYEGGRGKHFWEMLGGSFQLKSETNKIDLVVKTIVFSIPVFGQIAALLDSIFNSAQSKKDNLEKLNNAVKAYVTKFNEFISEWQKEDKIQHPEKYKVTPSNPDPPIINPPMGTPETPKNPVVNSANLSNNQVLGLGAAGVLAVVFLARKNRPQRV